MLVNKGNKVPDSEQALILYPAWENGYIGNFHKGMYSYCVGCNYTVLISAKSEGYINVGATLAGHFTDLRRFEKGEVYDAVGRWSSQCYNYKVTNPRKDFRVKLQSFGGDPDVYVSPNIPITGRNFT